MSPCESNVNISVPVGERKKGRRVIHCIRELKTHTAGFEGKERRSVNVASRRKKGGEGVGGQGNRFSLRTYKSKTDLPTL